MRSRFVSAIVLGLILMSAAPASVGAAGKPAPAVSAEAGCTVVNGEKHLFVTVTWSRVKASSVWAVTYRGDGSGVEASAGQPRDTVKGTLTTGAFSNQFGLNTQSVSEPLRWHLRNQNQVTVRTDLIPQATVQAVLDNCS